MSSGTSERRYIDTVEVAKLLRKALKAEFPGVKFSVRSSRYAGGSSIHVDYTDGPRQQDVQAVCNRYCGASFDGMIDLKEYHDSIITTENGAEVVHFGADFIHAQREFSSAERESARQFVIAHILKWNVKPISGSGDRALYPMSTYDHRHHGDGDPEAWGLALDEHNGRETIDGLARQINWMLDLR